MPIPALPDPNPKGSPVPDQMAAVRASKFAKVSGERLLPVAPNNPFLLRHHEGNWRWSTTLEEPTLLPEVTKMVLEPGVNGVRTTNENERDQPQKAYEQAVWRAEKDGWVYLTPAQPLPAHCVPPGAPTDSYLCEIDCKHPLTTLKGVYHLEVWCQPADTIAGEAQKFTFHRESYERWLLWLVESGQVAPPKPIIGQRMIERAKGHIRRPIRGLDPEVKAERIAALKARLDLIERAASNLPKQRAANRGASASLLDQAVSAIAAALETGEHDDSLIALLRAERAGKDRAGAVKAIENRIGSFMGGAG